MFVTFSSDAYENISYFNDVANQLLNLMGHSGTVPGALKSDQVAGALANLKHGLEQYKTPSGVDNDADEPVISIGKRAIPLINLLESAARKDCNVLWSTSNSPG